MATIFGPNWEHLELAEVAAFLEAADAEPLVWEAKGTDIDRHQIRVNVCGFGNSHEGGYLILGADERDGDWHVDGYEFPDEPPVWIDNLVRNEVRPTPWFDVRSWQVEDGRHVAVVRVEPIATPPCITRGTVYERVPGRTIPVKEPLRLADLYGRGDGARAEAQAKARRVRWEMLKRGWEHPTYAGEWVQIALGAATVGYQPDISSRLFSERFRTELMALAGSILGSGAPLEFGQRLPEIRQDVHVLTTTAPGVGGSEGWTVLGSWDGAVGLYWVIEVENTTSRSLVENVVANAWKAAVVLLDAIGAYGSAYVALAVCGAGHPTNFEPKGIEAISPDEPGTHLDRGPIELKPASLDLASLERELNRALGFDAFEPEGA